MKIIDYCVVHKGIKPLNNDDNIYLNGYFLPRINDGLDNYKLKINNNSKELVYAVFDGIGGLGNGDYASNVASTNITKGLTYINNKLLEIKHNEFIDLGTTASIVKINKNNLYIEQVGDSPVYIYSNNKLYKYIEKKDNNNLLDNYLGKQENIIIEKNSMKLKNKDIIVICSDGLSSMISDTKIEEIISSSYDIKYITNKLLNEALKNGGNDNISIVTLKVEKILGIF